MGKVVNLIKNYFNYCLLGISVISFVSFFCPFIRFINLDFPEESYNIYYYEQLNSNTVFYKRNLWDGIIKLILVIIPLILCLVNAFNKNSRLTQCALFCSITFNSYFIIDNISLFIPAAGSKFIPHVGYFIILMSLILCFFMLVIHHYDPSENNLIKKERKIKTTKPLKSSERTEILELKLQVSELQKQIEELKKDG